MASVLIIEDEEVLAKAVKRTLEKLGHRVYVADRCDKGERLFTEVRPDLTLLDLRLPDGAGLDLLPRLRAQQPTASIIIMTAYAAVEDAVRAMKLGACDYLQKPLNMDDVRHAVGRALDEIKLRTEVSYYRARDAQGTDLDAIVGTCPAVVDVRARLNRLCSLPASAAPPTVLITGETGTGKGLLARVLHYNGPRAQAPFIEINCAAIPENLVESELFGHERGAFTDAKNAKVGLFQAADQGTIFLDEVGCLPLMAQVKLLKVIEEKTVRPVGGRTERSVDVQIVAATNGDCEAMVRAGTFREDLYYRLCVAVLVASPLRERGDDVLLLANRFLAELAERYRLPRRSLSTGAERALRSWAWPGNVRELRNTLDRAVLFSDGSTIEAAALGLPEAGPGWMRLRLGPGGALEIDLPDSGIQFEELERALIVEALRKSGGRQSDAAKLLGMSRDTLRYRVEKFGIDPTLAKDS